MPVLAFLGATGGCAGQTLTLALRSGSYTCRALARSPEKLTSSLQSRGVTSEALQRLIIIRGDATNTADVKRLLTPENGNAISAIVFGVGSLPKLQWSVYPVTLVQPRLCETAMRTLLAALESLVSTGMTRPDVVALSSTGISSGPRDVPFLYGGLYHWLLKIPHDDKRAMEKLLWNQTKREKKERVVKRFVIVRPTLLTDGRKGLDKVRWGGEGNPAVGYMIGREDVGEFIYEWVLQDDGEGKDSVGRDVAVTLSY